VRLIKTIRKRNPEVQLLLFSATFNDLVREFAVRIAPNANQARAVQCTTCAFPLPAPLLLLLLLWPHGRRTALVDSATATSSSSSDRYLFPRRNSVWTSFRSTTSREYSAMLTGATHGPLTSPLAVASSSSSSSSSSSAAAAAAAAAACCVPL
jgi:hypothetical protein